MRRLREIASFVADTPAAGIPQEATARAALALVDYVGVAVAGSAEPVAGIIARHAARHGEGPCTVIGTPLRVGAAEAAFANAVAGHALDFDDSSFVLGGHPSVTLLPALLAVGEEQHSTGRAILEAYVIGFEVMMKFARAVNFEHYEKGWHPTATLGTFGTAAAVARLMRAPAAAVRHALSLAASMASGVKANFGAMSKAVQVGQASQKGLLCVQLALEGVTASEAAIEGSQGFLEVYNGRGQYRAEALTAFGSTPEILESGLMFKRYPCCGATHAPIDAALDFVRARPPSSADIESATIAINRRRLPHVDRPVVTTGLEAKFSVQYAVAAALTDGAIGLRHFGEAAIARADLQRMTARVVAAGVDGGEALSQACELTVQLAGGEKLTVRRADADGREAADYPRYMEAKFTDCIGHVFGAEVAAALLSQWRAFDQCADVAGPMRGLGGAARNERNRMKAT